MSIPLRDLKFEVFRISPTMGWAGPPAWLIRATHLPTGLSAESSSAKSQMQNRDIALAELTRLVKEQQK